MLSEHAKKIIKDIDDVYKKKSNIDCLLREYDKKSERDFIQKVAETEIAYLGKKLTWLALLFSIIALFIGVVGTLGLSLFPDSFKPYLILYVIIIILYFIALLYFGYILLKDLFFPKKDIFKDIIIEIEADNMPKKPTCYFSQRCKNYLYRIKQSRYWFMQSIKDMIKRFKDLLYLEREDRKRLIEVILIVGSILTALKTPETLNGNIVSLNENTILMFFMLFIVCSIPYYILIQKEIKEEAKMWVSALAFIISAAFSAIMAMFVAFSVANTFPTLSSAESVYHILSIPYWLVLTVIMWAALYEK